MPTSGVTAFPLTARDAVKKAMQEAKILGLGREPKAAELEDGIFALNLILKGWQTHGLSQWAETVGAMNIAAGQPSGVIAAGIRDVITAAHVQSGVERQLTKVGRGEYFDIPVKNQPGVPFLFHVARQRDAGVMYVWPVPSTNITLNITYERRLDTVTDGAETLDFPEEYTSALIAVLAMQLGTKYGAELPPELAVRAQRLEMAMFDDDRPESYKIGAWEYS